MNEVRHAGDYPAPRLDGLPVNASGCLHRTETFLKYGAVSGERAKRTLNVLRGLRLRLSFLVIYPPHPSTDQQVRFLGSALETLGVIEHLPDGALGLLYFGPRLHGVHGDRAVEAQILRRASEVLDGHSAESFGLRAAHLWADEIPPLAEAGQGATTACVQ